MHRVEMLLSGCCIAMLACTSGATKAPTAQPRAQQRYEHEDTRELVALVDDAARLVEAKGEAAFAELRTPGSRWRQDESYIFVLDPAGTMLLHPDPTMEGKNELDLEDIDGRPIIRGLIDAATARPGKEGGWYHYQWPVPGGLLARWKSSYVRLVETPAGERFVVGSGVYNDRMERAFVVDMVKDAVGRIAKLGEAAFPLFRDRTGPFVAKDAYIFVIEPGGVEVVNPAFPNLEGRSVLAVKDTQGKPLVQEMLEVVETRGSGWVDYMWPRPGDSVSTQKSTYVEKVAVGDSWLLVGCGVYLADAPKAAPDGEKMKASELMALVREGATLFEQRGEAAFPELRRKGSKWFRDDTYFFVYTLDGIRRFHAANPTLEGQDVSGTKDVLGRPYGKWFLETATSPAGEGWVHYMYPEPGDIFPAWKSVFVKRVRSPEGKDFLIAAGIYNMQMDRAFVEDVVGRAVALVDKEGKGAFPALRDPKGPFVFMDTYIFVERIDGLAMVNAAQPSLEGKNLIDVRDGKGEPMVREYLARARKEDAFWTDYVWYRPGSNEPTRKHAFIRRVDVDGETYVVGSGVYLDE